MSEDEKIKEEKGTKKSLFKKRFIVLIFALIAVVFGYFYMSEAQKWESQTMLMLKPIRFQSHQKYQDK